MRAACSLAGDRATVPDGIPVGIFKNLPSTHGIAPISFSSFRGMAVPLS